MSDRVTANIPRTVHKKVKVISDLNGLKMYDVYEELLKLGWESFKEKNRTTLSFGELKDTVVEREPLVKEERTRVVEREEDGVSEVLSNILHELKKNQERMDKLESIVDNRTVIEEIVPEPMEETESMVEDEVEIVTEEIVPEVHTEEVEETEVEEWKDVEIPKKFSRMIKEFTTDTFEISETELARVKKHTREALKYLLYKETMTKKEAVSEVFGDDENKWVSYAYYGLKELGVRTESHNRECIVHPTIGETIWRYIKDIDDFYVPYSDIEELPEDIKTVLGPKKPSRIPLEKEKYGAGIRCARYLQIHGEANHSDFTEKVYCDANRISIRTWWETYARPEMQFIGKKTGRIEFPERGQSTYRWIPDEELEKRKKEAEKKKD